MSLDYCSIEDLASLRTYGFWDWQEFILYCSIILQEISAIKGKIISMIAISSKKKEQRSISV